jgi:hypothetical protein
MPVLMSILIGKMGSYTCQKIQFQVFLIMGIGEATLAVKIGRKNYLFAGSHEAAQHTAVICSSGDTFKQPGIFPKLMSYICSGEQ